MNFFKYKKVLSINILVFLFLTITPSIFLFTYRSIKKNLVNNSGSSIYEIASYPIYSKDFNPHKFFNTNDSIQHEYRSYIGWRPQKIKSELINISEKYNNRYSIGEKIDNSTWFFGGSTMWGFGVPDKGTIPSIYSSLTQESVFNFGEGAWTAQQSLNQLIIAIADNRKPSKIIFYDGVNEVYTGCKNNTKRIPSNEYHTIIFRALENERSLKKQLRSITYKVYDFIKEPYEKVLVKLNLYPKNVSKTSMFDCNINKTKANKIASHLVNTWYTAFLIAKDNNAEFFAILQPTVFDSNKESEYFTDAELSLQEELRPQFETVYNLILKKIKNKCSQNKLFCESFIDGTQWVSNYPNVFIDYCHLNSMGNKVITKNMVKYFNEQN